MSRAQPAPRVRLTPPDEIDSLPLPWLAEAYAALDGRGALETTPVTAADLAAATAGRWLAASLALITLLDGEPLGFVVVERRSKSRKSTSSGTRTDSAIIHALAIRRAERNFGYGVEAVELIEAVQAVERLYAPIPRTNGLALYFWLRAGYRPVCDQDEPDLSRDPLNLWMVRSKGVSDARQDP